MCISGTISRLVAIGRCGQTILFCPDLKRVRQLSGGLAQEEMKERNYKYEESRNLKSVSAIYECANGNILCVRVHKERGIGKCLCAYIDVHTSDHRSEYHLNDWYGDDRRWSVKYIADSEEIGQTSGRREIARALDMEVGLGKVKTILRRLVAHAGWLTYISYYRKRVIDPITDRVGMDWGNPIIGLI